MVKHLEYMFRNHDQFYTTTNCVSFVLNKSFSFLRRNKIKINNKNIFIEPSAGTGSFVKFLQKNNFSNIEAYDIEPKYPNVRRKNFFDLKLKFNKRNIVIGNPPFGYKAKKAIEFINRSLTFSDIVIFVLPIQFRRWLTQNKINKDAKLIYSSQRLNKNSFVYKDKPYSVNCIFQIWVNNTKKFKKFKNLRILSAPANKHNDFKTWIYNNTKSTLKYFNQKIYKWDIAVARQGYCDYSKIFTNSKGLSKKHQYLFVKFNNKKARTIFKKIDFVELAESNTSIKGFSNTDLVKKYLQLC